MAESIPDHYGYKLLVSLTQHRDLDALNRAFLDALSFALPKLAFRIYIHTEQYGHWRLMCGTNLELARGDRVDQSVKKHDLSLIDSIGAAEDDAKYIAEGKTFVCLFPIRLGRDYFAALISDGFYQPSGNVLLESLISMYSNVYTLLYRMNHDPLTGLLNRESFSHAVEMEAHDGGTSAAQLVIIDIDYFKKINDTHGHLRGDAALVQLAGLMIDSFRDNDYLFRFGGEEFVVLLHDSSGENAHAILDRFRETVANTEFEDIGRITISMGYAKLDPALPQHKIVSRADRALYYAKEHGRNQLQCYERLAELGWPSA